MCVLTWEKEQTGKLLAVYMTEANVPLQKGEHFCDDMYKTVLK